MIKLIKDLIPTKIVNKIKYGFFHGSIKDTKISSSSVVHPTANLFKSNVDDNSVLLRDCDIIESDIGKYCKIFDRSYLFKVILGDYSYVNMYTTILRTNIGKYNSIASHVYIGPTPHPLNKVTTHPFIFLKEFGELIGHDDEKVKVMREETKTEIGNDVWIGQGATIFPNIRIENGAVIGARSVVTKDVGAYEIVAGVPAKLIRKRFTDENIEELQSIKWWDWKRELLISRIADFNEIDIFIEKYRNNL